MSNQKSSLVKKGVPTSAAEELEIKRKAAAKLEKKKKAGEKNHAAKVQAEMAAMNQNPRMMIREVFDPAGNLIQKEVEISPRDASLVEFDRDSKGMVKPRVKIYHEDPKVALQVAIDLMKEAVKEAEKMSL